MMRAIMPVGHEMSTQPYAQPALTPDHLAGHNEGMKNLRKLRLERGLTQAELADMIGVNQATISKIERGSEAVTLDLVFRIAATLNVPAGLLFDLPELHERVLGALSRVSEQKQAAAVVVIEAMARE